MKKKPVILALLQSALVVTLLVGAPLAADAEMHEQKMPDGVGKPADAQLNTPPLDNRMDRGRADVIEDSRVVTTPDRVLERTDADSALIDQVNRSLDSSGYSGVGVDATLGRVRLDGWVADEQQRDAIINNVQNVGGVRAVDSYLRLQDSPMTP